MKKYLVIGNPIKHSLSPKLHSYWIKKNNIDAIYEKEKLDENDLENLILKVKDKIIHVGAGAGVVADSVPENEWLECRQKSKVFMDAMEMIS